MPLENPPLPPLPPKASLGAEACFQMPTVCPPAILKSSRIARATASAAEDVALDSLMNVAMSTVLLVLSDEA